MSGVRPTSGDEIPLSARREPGSMIELTGVTKRYRRGMRDRVTALDALDLRVTKGATLAVIGPNGSGKSTLFRVVAGLARPDDGSVLIDGKRPVTWIRAHGMGLLPDRVGLPDGHSVREALHRLAILDGCAGSEIRTRVGRALDSTGLADRAGAKCGSLSRGLRQRVGIAQLLLRPRPLVLLDEPLSGLDPVWRSRFREILGQLRTVSPDTTVLFSSHELPEAARFADHVAVIQQGRLVDEFVADEDVEALERRVLGLLATGAGK